MGTFYVVLAGVCWGLISIFIRKFSSAGIDSLQISCIRSWVSVILLALFFLIKDKKLFVIRLKDIWMFIGSGILSLTFFSYCYFTSIVSCGAAIAVVLLYTSPIFVMILSAIFFKEKITATKLIALLVTFLGCVLVAGLVGGAQWIGLSALMTGLGAGFGYALYSLFGGLASRKYSSLTVTFYTLLLSGISLLFICKPVRLIEKVGISLLPYMLGIALICTMIPYIAYTYGLQKMEASKAAVLVTVEPLVGCILGMAVFEEACNITKIAGIVLIFAAVVMLSLEKYLIDFINKKLHR